MNKRRVLAFTTSLSSGSVAVPPGNMYGVCTWPSPPASPVDQWLYLLVTCTYSVCTWPSPPASPVDQWLYLLVTSTYSVCTWPFSTSLRRHHWSDTCSYKYVCVCVCVAMLYYNTRVCWKEERCLILQPASFLMVAMTVEVCSILSCFGFFVLAMKPAICKMWYWITEKVTFMEWANIQRNRFNCSL